MSFVLKGRLYSFIYEESFTHPLLSLVKTEIRVCEKGESVLWRTDSENTRATRGTSSNEKKTVLTTRGESTDHRPR